MGQMSEDYYDSLQMGEKVNVSDVYNSLIRNEKLFRRMSIEII